MAREFSELIKLFKDADKALDAVLPDVATSVSLAAKAFSQRTIIDRGFGESYSSAEMPIYFFTGFTSKRTGVTYHPKTKSERGDLFLAGKKADGEYKVSYKDLRQAEELQINYVDLTFSGEMWRTMFPKDVEINGNYYIAPLGCNTRSGQEKLNWQYERYGNFFERVLTGDNLQKMYDVANAELVRFLEKYLE